MLIDLSRNNEVSTIMELKSPNTVHSSYLSFLKTWTSGSKIETQLLNYPQPKVTW